MDWTRWTFTVQLVTEATETFGDDFLEELVCVNDDTLGGTAVKLEVLKRNSVEVGTEKHFCRAKSELILPCQSCQILGSRFKLRLVDSNALEVESDVHFRERLDEWSEA